jgi:uncharacterized protein YukE
MIVEHGPRYSRVVLHDHGFGWGFRSLRGLCWLPRTYRWAVAGSFGDAEGVRRLGQALVAAGRGLAAVTDDLSGRVRGLIPSGWSGGSAEAFGSDWNAKAGQAGQLAAVCDHAGQVLTALADQLEAANGQVAQAQQMTGGPASRFALPAAEQQAQQMLSQASSGAQQARAAARAKLAGIAVPRIGPALTVSEADAWAERLAPPQHKSAPWYDTLLHGAESGGLSALKDLGDLVGLGPAYRDPSFGQTWVGMWHGAEDFSTGFVADGLLGTLKGLGDLAGLGPAYGDPSFVQTWGGMGHLVEPWNWNTFTQSWESLGKGLLAWNEWKSDPARAEGQVAFNAATLGLAGLLKLGDAGEVAADTGKTAESAGNASRLSNLASKLPDMTESQAQLEAKFKHAGDFGVTEPRGAAGFDAYGKVLDKFVRDSSTVRVRGSYRGEPAILNYNPTNRLVVVQAPDGAYVSGWQMSRAQLQHVISRRSLGGG